MRIVVFLIVSLLTLTGCLSDGQITMSDVRGMCTDITDTHAELKEAGYKFTDASVQNAFNEANAICSNPPTDARSAMRKLTIRLLILSNKLEQVK